MNPLPSDGWRSRKLLVGVGALVVVLGVPTGALLTGHATLVEWTDAVQLLVPGVLAPLFGGLGLDKLAESRRSNGAAGDGGG